MKDIAHFLYEVGQLNKIPRAGSVLGGLKNPESVGEHTCRSVFVGFILGKMEKVDAEKVALICAFHEIGETRIGDLHKVASNYFSNKKEVEKKAVADQLSMLPDDIANGFKKFLDGEGHDSSPEHIVAKDADYIEAMITAREHIENGHTQFQNWIDNASKCLKTESAKKLAAAIIETRSTEWYEGLKKIQR